MTKVDRSVCRNETYWTVIKLKVTFLLWLERLSLRIISFEGRRESTESFTSCGLAMMTLTDFDFIVFGALNYLWSFCFFFYQNLTKKVLKEFSSYFHSLMRWNWYPTEVRNADFVRSHPLTLRDVELNSFSSFSSSWSLKEEKKRVLMIEI